MACSDTAELYFDNVKFLQKSFREEGTKGFYDLMGGPAKLERLWGQYKGYACEGMLEIRYKIYEEREAFKYQ